MEVELKEIRDFVGAIPPFDRLPPERLDQLVKHLSIEYLRRGQPLQPADTEPPRLYVIRRGALALRSGRDTLMGMLGEGDVCTSFCAAELMPAFEVEATEDSLLYSIPCQDLDALAGDDPTILNFIRHSAAQRLGEAVARMQAQSQSSLLHSLVGDHCRSPVVAAPPDLSIRDAARRMTEAKVSSLLIVRDDDPVGILTDRDIRTRCVAAGLDPERPVETIMTRELIRAQASESLFDALLRMTRKGVHHLPVFDDQGLRGMLAITDIMRQEGLSSVHLTSTIRKADSVEALAEAAAQLPRLQAQLVELGADLYHLGHAVSAVADALAVRLIELYEARHGEAPVPWAWVCAGSQARREQTCHSDQDNALILSDEVHDEQLPWFDGLARFVNDGLDACGFSYCPGEVMASNPKWRQPARVWRSYFEQWITEPEPKALMLSSIFFDLRLVHGEATLLEGLRRRILELTPRNQLFLGHLARNALTHRPPLGFFRDFVLVHDGKHDDTLDLKHSGLVPIVDMARLYALAEGLPAIDTRSRLQAAAGTPSLSRGGAANLLDAFQFIGRLRLEHQTAQIRAGQTPDNYVSPKGLSKLEREHLKDAFKVVQTMQAHLELRYQTGRL